MNENGPENLPFPAEVSPAQQTALTRLIAGDMPSAAARAAGVHRGTLHRWLRHDPTFRRAVQEAKAAARELARVQLSAVVSEAVELISAEVNGGSVQVAMAVVRSMRLIDQIDALSLDPGPTPAPAS